VSPRPKTIQRGLLCAAVWLGAGVAAYLMGWESMEEVLAAWVGICVALWVLW
jgi:hypothetical protein